MTALRLGTGIAVLLPDPGRGARDEAATAALRRATGHGDIAIARRPSGRPRLAPPHAELGVSIAARGGLLLAGFATDTDVGVDIELSAEAAGLDPLRLACDHFTRAEANAIAGLDDLAVQQDCFLRLWVAKEAALKMTGRGVYDGLGWPDLAQHVAALVAEAPVHVPAQGERPAVAVLVRRFPAGPDGHAYVALALRLAPGQSGMMPPSTL